MFGRSKTIVTYNNKATKLGKYLVLIVKWNEGETYSFKTVRQFSEFGKTPRVIHAREGDQLSGCRGWKLESVEFKRDLPEEEAADFPNGSVVRVTYSK